ncbi:MAG: MarR family winged helix-turn-helix transcriptional regulator [Janthinobacterium lividum]
MAFLTERHFGGLLAVRSGIAAFERLGERDARALGTTHTQHHVLLTLRGHPHPDGATVKDVASALGVASPSAVELVARMRTAGLLERHADARDARVTRLELTPLGEQLLYQLAEAHLPRLHRLVTRGVDQLAD